MIIWLTETGEQSKGGGIPQQHCDRAFHSAWSLLQAWRMSAGMVTKQAVTSIPNNPTSMITEPAIWPWDFEPSTCGDIVATRRPATVGRKKATSTANPSTAVRGSLNMSATDSRVNAPDALWGQQFQQNHRDEHEYVRNGSEMEGCKWSDEHEHTWKKLVPLIRTTWTVYGNLVRT